MENVQTQLLRVCFCILEELQEKKTLTNINVLLEQDVNLAYHGMRALNKEFNITIEKDYDELLQKINVVPQDISRVFLNIVNNACYAANQKN